jgi:polysaccharide export outer membrane protein
MIFSRVEVEIMSCPQALRFITIGLGLAVCLFVFSETARAQESQVQPVSAVVTKSAGDTKSAPNNNDDPKLQHRYPRYRVQHSDVLSISFPLSPEFDQSKVTVQPDGYINLTNVGSIYVEGMTVPQVVEALKKAYAGILHDPIIDVDLVDFQRPFFLVSGQVGKPGQYELRHETTLSEAIAMAGGFAPTAKTQVFLYHRVSPDWVEVRKINLKDYLGGKKVEEDATISSGDQIFVPEKFITKFRKYVPYGLGTSVGLMPYY